MEVREESQNNKRIAKNASLLYFRMLLLMVVNLYTSRVLLQALGVDDFAVYHVVGGCVALFSVLSGTLSASISRFIVYELGGGTPERLQRIFSTSLMIQLGLSVLIILLAETIGLYYVNCQMTCPPDRFGAANWCYQLSLFTFCVNLMSVPYNAEIIAHERMSAFAYISIIEAVGYLAIAFLIAFSSTDRLILYAVLMSVQALLIRVCYVWYCRRRFAECVFHWLLDRALLKRMLSFAGWNMVGAAAGVIREQGGLLLVNAFFSLAVNSALVLSMKVNTAVSKFVQNFMVALNPQITKSYAAGNQPYMFKLIFQGSRFAAYLLLLLSVPVLLNTAPLLDFWLADVPPHTVSFVRLILLLTLSESLSYPLITAMLATGDIRDYQLVVGGLQLLNIPVSYLLLRWGSPAEVVLLVSIALSQCCLFARLLLLRKMISLDVGRFLKQVYANVLLVAVVGGGFSYAFNQLMTEDMSRLYVMSPVIIVVLLLTEFFVGCDVGERQFAIQKARAYLTRYNIRI